MFDIKYKKFVFIKLVLVYFILSGTLVNADSGFDFDNILENMDHRFGWLDLYMQIAYFVIGKHYSINTNLTEVWKTPNFRESDFTLVHAYKELY